MNDQMNAAIRITGLCCLTVCLCVALLLTPDKPEVWGGILGLMGLALGQNDVKSAVKYVFRIK